MPDLERLHVKLDETASGALARILSTSGGSKTDAVRRALILLDQLLTQEAGGTVFLRREPGEKRAVNFRLLP